MRINPQLYLRQIAVYIQWQKNLPVLVQERGDSLSFQRKEPSTFRSLDTFFFSIIEFYTFFPLLRKKKRELN